LNLTIYNGTINVNSGLESQVICARFGHYTSKCNSLLHT